MDTEYRIGAFAELSGVSVKTLRFYDQIGLLRPARVDPRTQYRFYRPEQLRQLAVIIELKDAGASLGEIHRFSKRAAFESGRRQILHDLKRAAERTIEQATRSLRWIDSVLEQREADDHPIPVVIKRRRAVPIASIRAQVDHYEQINQLESELLGALPEPSLGELRGVLWHSCADSGALEGEAFVSLKRQVPAKPRYELGQLPAATLACAYSSLDDDSAEKTYAALSKWTGTRGYRLVGPKREISHGRVLEIQYPVVP